MTGHAGLINEDVTPDEVTITVAYEDVHGRPYADQFPLNVDTVLLTTYGISSSSIKGAMQTLAAQSKKHAAAAESMARTLKEATRHGTSGQVDSARPVDPADALQRVYSRVVSPSPIAPGAAPQDA